MYEKKRNFIIEFSKTIETRKDPGNPECEIRVMCLFGIRYVSHNGDRFFKNQGSHAKIERQPPISEMGVIYHNVTRSFHTNANFHTNLSTWDSAHRIKQLKRLRVGTVGD